MNDAQKKHLRLLGIARYEDMHGDKEVAKVIEWAFDEIERLWEANKNLQYELEEERRTIRWPLVSKWMKT